MLVEDIFFYSDSITGCSISKFIPSRFGINYSGWKIKFIGKHSDNFFVNNWSKFILWYRKKFLHQKSSIVNSHLYNKDENDEFY
jgi:hypothetical protein